MGLPDVRPRLRGTFFISRATHVVVIDADSGKNVGEIPDTPGVHGIALAPEFDRGFISNGREGTVTYFRSEEFEGARKNSRSERIPDAILYDPASKRVFTFNGKSHDATAIDAAKGTVVGTIKLNGKPEFAVSDESGKDLREHRRQEPISSNSIPNKFEVKSRWPLAPCEEPSGIGH